MGRDVRQVDTMSAKLFTLALEDVFKEWECSEMGINETYLVFYDSLPLMSLDLDEMVDIHDTR